jgi:pimeloyl-ACP methyl ester carboxylesterase
MKRSALVQSDSFPVLPAEVPPWPGERVLVDGAATYVRRTPATVETAEWALYLHGLGGSSLNWTDLAYLLAGEVHGEAIDLPGFGFSDPARRYGVADAADRVIRWIEHADRGPVHLVGNSLGGAIAVRVTGTRPDLVRTLTLVSPAMPFLDPRRSLHSRLLPVLLLPRAERLVTRRLATIPPEVLAQQVIEACFADPNAIPPQRLLEAVDEVKRRYEAPWYVGAYLSTLRGLVSGFLRAYLPGGNSQWRMARKITAPTLVVAGRLDRLVDVRVGPIVAEIIPDSRLLMLDGVGHVAQMEQPRLVARGMAALLHEVRAAAAEEATTTVTVEQPATDTPRPLGGLATRPMRA